MKLLGAQKTIFVTEEVHDKETAITKKMQILQPKFLGISLVKYEYCGEQKVYIPYRRLLFDYRIDRSKKIKQEGRTLIIFDCNEPHAFFGEHEELKTLAGGERKVPERQILPMQCSEDEMIKQCEDTIERQLLLKTFKGRGRITLAESSTFYRPAWKLHLKYKDREIERYAYLDAYGAFSERIKGLRARTSG